MPDASFGWYDDDCRLISVSEQFWVLQGDIWIFGIDSFRRGWVPKTDSFKSVCVHSFKRHMPLQRINPLLK